MRPGGGSPGGASWKRRGPTRTRGRGRRKAVGRLVASRLRVRPLRAFGLRGLAEQGSVHAQRCLCAHGCVPCRGSSSARATPRGGSFVFHSGTTPLSPENDLLLCPLREMLFSIPDPMESFAEQVSGVKLLDLGQVGGWRNSVVETRTKIFAGGYLGAGAAASQRASPS